MKVKVKVKSLSHVLFFATPWTVTYRALWSMGFSRQEYWSGLPFPSPEDLLNPGTEPGSLALQADSLLSEPLGKPCIYIKYIYIGIDISSIYLYLSINHLSTSQIWAGILIYFPISHLKQNTNTSLLRPLRFHSLFFFKSNLKKKIILPLGRVMRENDQIAGRSWRPGSVTLIIETNSSPPFAQVPRTCAFLT